MTPRDHLTAFSRQYPGIWPLIDAVRRERRQDDPAWPEHVFLPLEAAGHAMATWYSVNRPAETLRPATLVSPATYLAGFATWRVTQGVYRYDPTLYRALLDTRIEAATPIPISIFARLPEWCVYVETPGMTVPVPGGEVVSSGMWAWMDHTPEGTNILTLIFHCDALGRLPVGHIPLLGTLDDAVARVETEWRSAYAQGNAEGAPPETYARAARATFGPLLSLLLYLCSEEPDIDGRPYRPLPKRTKRGERLFAADKIHAWNVGERFGAALRKAYQEQDASRVDGEPGSNRARPKAHIRRAHWHTFLSGSKRRERRLKWLPPIAVGVADFDELPTTVREVF